LPGKIGTINSQLFLFCCWCYVFSFCR
jgi:hypothetical protein